MKTESQLRAEIAQLCRTSSQEAVGQQLGGYPRQVISAIVNGKRRIPPRLAEALGYIEEEQTVKVDRIYRRADEAVK